MNYASNGRKVSSCHNFFGWALSWPGLKILSLRARRKLALPDSTTKLDDLRTPAGNDLHSLAVSREGQYAIRVNDKYRLCFTWNHEDGSANNVEIIDYH